MRNYQELKKLAYAGSDKLDMSNPFDFAVWMSLWHLYKMYAQGLLSKESAVRLESETQQYYKILLMWESIYEKYAGIEAATEFARAEYRKNPTQEHAMELLHMAFPDMEMAKKDGCCDENVP
jgi:predicted P-loop ATPase